MSRVTAGLLLCSLACLPRAEVPRPSTERARLLERSVLPAATFGPPPTSGARLLGTPGAPYASQPVQGFSSLQVDDGGFFTISDNGYGVPENSSDFELRAWRLSSSNGALSAAPLFVLVTTGSPQASASIAASGNAS